MADFNEDKQAPPRNKPQAATEPTERADRPVGNTGKRGEATVSSGNKIHGDKLEGMIPGKPDRPQRDDGDDEGEK